MCSISLLPGPETDSERCSSAADAQGDVTVDDSDTLRTASQMESHSLPCRIQCTEQFAEVLVRQGPDVHIMRR